MVSIFQLQDVLESLATMQKVFLRELETDQELLVGKLTVLNISSADRRGDQDTVLLRTKDNAVWRSVITLTEMHARRVAAWRQVNSTRTMDGRTGEDTLRFICSAREGISSARAES